MTDNDLLQRYNYDAFIPESFGPWMRFDESPPLAQKGPRRAIRESCAST